MSRPDPPSYQVPVEDRIERARVACREGRLIQAVENVLELSEALYRLGAAGEHGLLVLDALERGIPSALKAVRQLTVPYLRGGQLLILAELAARSDRTELVRELMDEYLATRRVRYHPQEYHTFSALESALGWIVPRLAPPRLEVLAERMPPWFTLRLQRGEPWEPGEPRSPSEEPEAEILASLARLRGEPRRPFDPVRPGAWEWNHLQLAEELLARSWSRAQDWFFLLDRVTMPYLRGRLLLRLEPLLPVDFFLEYRERCLPGARPARDKALAAMRLLLAPEPDRSITLGASVPELLQAVALEGPVSAELVVEGAALGLYWTEVHPPRGLDLMDRLLDTLRPELPPERQAYLMDRLLDRVAQATRLDQRHVPMIDRLARKVREIRRHGRAVETAIPVVIGPVALLTRCSLLLYRATGLDEWVHPGRLGIDRLSPMLDYLETVDPPSGYLQALAVSLGLPPSARELLGMLLRGPVWPATGLAETPTPRDLVRLAHLLPDDGRLSLRGDLIRHLQALEERIGRDGGDEDCEIWLEAVPELFWLGLETLPRRPVPAPETVRRCLPWALLNEPESVRSRVEMARRFWGRSLRSEGLLLESVVAVVEGLAQGAPPENAELWARALREGIREIRGPHRDWLVERLLAEAARWDRLRPVAEAYLRSTPVSDPIHWLATALAESVTPDAPIRILESALATGGGETHGWSPLVDRICREGGIGSEPPCELLGAMVDHALCSEHAPRDLLTAALDAVRIAVAGGTGEGALERLMKRIGLEG